MPPKEPIRIGLTKNKSKNDVRGENVELPDSPADLDKTVPPLSASVMNVLEDLVDSETEDLFADEIERDNDPDYVQPEPEPVAGPSRLVKEGRPKPVLNLVTVSVTDGKGRSTAPIWDYFDVSDKLVNGRMEKGAVCKVDMGGVPCGKRIMQNGSSTTGLNQHLERRHPAAFEECKTKQINIQAEKLATKRTLNDRFDDLEGTPSKKLKPNAPGTPSSALKPLPKTPWDRVLKYDVRGKMQLRWDLWITEYWVRLGLPWSMLDQPAHKEFWAQENPKYHCKNSTTYSRAKLPLLYDQVKIAVEAKIKKDVLHTSGVAFTADHWSSRSMDPYIGVTLHMIGKNWEMTRYNNRYNYRLLSKSFIPHKLNR
jgi:hypothetical protein